MMRREPLGLGLAGTAQQGREALNADLAQPTS